MGYPLADHAAVFSALADAGFTDAWSSEVAGSDAFTPLTLAAVWEPRLQLGTAIAPVFTRGPALLAMTAAALAETAPGRFRLGIGASSPVVVGDWNAVEFTEPFKRSRDVLRFLRAALAGEVVDGEFETFAVRRFRLERPPATPPRILLAALRPGMLRLAADQADGVILNWLSAGDVPTALAETKAAGPGLRGGGADLRVPDRGRRPTPGCWAGGSSRRISPSRPTPSSTAGSAGSRSSGRCGRRGRPATGKGALAAIPDEVVDDLIVHGSPAECRAKVQSYADAGVQVPVMALLPTPELEKGGAAALTELIPALGR